MNKTKILLVEDDLNLGSLLRDYLNAKGFETVLEDNGVKGLLAFNREHFDLCIIDVMMPVKDGFTLAGDIRNLDQETPFIFLTAKSMNSDIIKGFNLGADDYITKPFNMEELLMRIEAILRRTSKSSNLDIFILGDFQFNSNKQLLTREGREDIKLTTKESDLLKLLCQHSNQILDRNFALKSIWKDDSYFNARSMDVYITKLRKHLKDEPGLQIINVHGKGYKLIRD